MLKFNFLNLFKQDYWILRRYRPLVDAVVKQFQQWKHFKAKDIQQQATIIAKAVKAKQLQHDLLVIQAFALAMVAIYQVLQIELHKVQIYGSLTLHYGNVAEMKTGEGKTLTAILPAYLNHLLQHKIYVVTVNEYLVERDAENNRPILALLNVKVGKILANMTLEVKHQEYQNHDVIYATNSELGFDYLRDNMRNVLALKMQGSLDYVIIDEIDSVLIDEGRTPLIISGKQRNRTDYYQKVNQFVKQLRTSDYQIDRETHQICLSSAGITKAHFFFKITNLFGSENSELFHFINNALFAHHLLHKNIDYLVKKQTILLIDHFTGRILEGRTLSEGLHQAVEAKENCPIKPETHILASITYQNFFRLFKKIAGMTGTAKMESEELIALYNMHVVSIPTDQAVIRIDDNDKIYYSKRHKYLALLADIETRHARGQPILIGTNALEVSEEIATLLTKMKLRFKLLNAKHHAYEAKIILQAGRFKAITIATNMAGRGTDIKLDSHAKQAGGLAVLGVNRNDSRRIDLQLRGRSARQGEPGYSCFYLSLDDNLFSRFASPTINRMFSTLGDKPLQSRFLTRIVKRAQKQLANASYEQRKNILEYDNIMSQQRVIVYQKREQIIGETNLIKYWNQLVASFVQFEFEKFGLQFFDFNSTNLKLFRQIFVNLKLLTAEQLPLSSLIKLSDWRRVVIKFTDHYQSILNNLKASHLDLFSSAIKMIMVNNLDNLWSIYLDETDKLKAGAFLHSYAQKQPLQIFIEQTAEKFAKLKRQFIYHTIFETQKLIGRYLD